MPRHVHMTFNAALSQTERVLVHWLIRELNALREALGLAPVSEEGLITALRQELTPPVQDRS